MPALIILLRLGHYATIVFKLDVSHPDVFISQHFISHKGVPNYLDVSHWDVSAKDVSHSV